MAASGTRRAALAVVAAFAASVPLLANGTVGAPLRSWRSPSRHSLAFWALFSRRAPGPEGIAAGTVTGASVSGPFLHILGPAGGAAAGTVAEFAAFQLCRGPGEGLAAAAAIASAHVAMTAAAPTLPASVHMWDNGSGVGAWTGMVWSVEPTWCGLSRFWPQSRPRRRLPNQ